MYKKELKENYNNTLTEIMNTERKIKELEEKEEIKEYKLLISKLRTKRADLDGLARSINYITMNECNHIFVFSTRNYPLCIKCGLDFSVENLYTDMLNTKQRVMQQILENKDNINCEPIKDGDDYIFCPSSLAMEIYKEIIKENPNISDDATKILFKEKLKAQQKVKSKKW